MRAPAAIATISSRLIESSLSPRLRLRGGGGSGFSPDDEAREALVLPVDLVNALDDRSGRALVHEGDQALDGLRRALEHGLDGALGRVSHPPGDTLLLREPADRVPEEHALNETLDYDCPPHR